MVDKDGKMVKKVKPILIKKELNREHASKVPFERHPGEIFFADDERVLCRETEPVEYYEEATNDKDYKEDDDDVISIESDSTAAESMLDEDFETTDPVQIDRALQEITTRLHQAADGYETLRNLLPTILVTEVAEVVQAAPTPYLQPMSKAAIQALQTLGEDQLISQACVLEYQAGATQAVLMRKYGIGWDRLYKAIHGKVHPGGAQYQMLKKEQSTTKEEDTTKPVVKLEQKLDVPSPTPKEKGRGKSSQKKK